MNLRSLIKASRTIVFILILGLCTLIIFPSHTLAQTSFACEQSNATARQCVEDAITLQEKSGNLDDVEFFLERAIDKVDVISLVLAQSRLAELYEEKGNKSEAEQLVKTVIGIRNALGQNKTCPSCGTCGECTIGGKKGEFGFGGTCVVCPGQ
jgi:hypothetical protein